MHKRGQNYQTKLETKKLKENAFGQHLIIFERQMHIDERRFVALNVHANLRAFDKNSF